MDCQKLVYACYQLKDPFVCQMFQLPGIIFLLIRTKNWAHLFLIPVHVLKWTLKLFFIHDLNLSFLIF